MDKFFEIGFPQKEQGRLSTEKKVFISTLSIISFLAAFDGEAMAKIQAETIKPHVDSFESPVLEVMYTKDEMQKAPEYIRIVSLDDLGEKSTTEHISSYLFDLMNKNEVTVPEVNYSIQDESEFEKFLIRQSGDAKQRLNLSWSSMSDMKPKELTMTAIEIAHTNLKYEYSILKSPPTESKVQYDPELKRKIDAMPIDQLLRNGKGVCRHFSASVKTIFNTLKKISHSPYLNNISMHEVVYPDENHSVNVVAELVREQKGPVIKIMFIDTTPPSIFPVDNQKKLSVLVDALSTSRERIKGAFETYFFSDFSQDERREVLKSIFEFREQKAPNLSLLESIVSSYEQEIVRLHDEGSVAESENVKQEVVTYLKKVLPVMEAAVETPLHIPVGQLLRIINIYKNFGVFEEGVKILIDAYDHISTENQLQGKIQIGQEYAEVLAGQGDLDGAVKIYRKLFSDYQEYYSPEHPFAMLEKISTGQSIEPFLSESNLEEYLADKKQQWLKLNKESR